MIKTMTPNRAIHRHDAKFISPWIVYPFYGLIVLAVLVPFAWVFGLTSKTGVEVFSLKAWFGSAGFSNYLHVLKNTALLRQIFNSIIIGAGATTLALLVSVSGAYGCSRWNFPWKYPFMIGLLGLQLLPGATAIIPYYLLASRLNLLNTYTGLILILGAMRVPFTIWVLKGFFDKIPKSLEEAAMVDGALRHQTIMYIFIPLALPGIAAAIFINFLHTWNVFLLPMVINSAPRMRTAVVGLVAYQYSEGTVFYHYLATTGIINGVIIAVLYFIIQKNFVSGLLVGGVKA